MPIILNKISTLRLAFGLALTLIKKKKMNKQNILLHMIVFNVAVQKNNLNMENFLQMYQKSLTDVTY